MPLSENQAQNLEQYLRVSCADVDCGGFLEKLKA